MFIPQSRVPQTPMSQYLWHRHFQIHNYLHQIGVFGLFLDSYAHTNVCVKDIGSQASMVLQNYQHFIEMTSNMSYTVALGVGLKCPSKILLLWMDPVQKTWTRPGPKRLKVGNCARSTPIQKERQNLSLFSLYTVHTEIEA